MKRKFILLFLLTTLFAQVKFIQHEFTGKLHQKQMKLIVSDEKVAEPPLSLGSVRADIVRKKISGLFKAPEKDKQVHLFTTTSITNN